MLIRNLLSSRLLSLPSKIRLYRKIEPWLPEQLIECKLNLLNLIHLQKTNQTLSSTVSLITLKDSTLAKSFLLPGRYSLVFSSIKTPLVRITSKQTFIRN
jgi:hypothetical protein